MSEPDNTQEGLRWLRFSHEDLAAAQAMASDDQAQPRHVCWLSQQAAEKSVKALLVLHGVDFPRSHDLDFLSRLLPTNVGMEFLVADLDLLTEWAVEARYPGDWPEAGPEDAARALSEAMKVVRRAEAYFHPRPPDPRV